MRVVATGDQGSDLPEAVVARMPAYEHSKFNVSVEEEYAVYAMALWLSGIIILILDDNRRPHWYPVELFRISEPSMPTSWLFGYVLDRVSPLNPQAFWGYESLVRDPSHHAALVDRKISALRVFLDQCDRSNLAINELRKLETLQYAVS
jgi:hypothetical protein